MQNFSNYRLIVCDLRSASKFIEGEPESQKDELRYPMPVSLLEMGGVVA